jgi:hypothetical protein
VQPVQIRTAGATPGKHLPSLLWFLLPLGLLLAVVIARVVFDDDGPATATATAAPTAAVSAADRSAFERDEAPHVGPFTMVALAVGRLIRRRAT